ncbi:MAG: CBS domain-containing protein [Gemmatimonadota bacterium]|nr:CBS domain-containing protein [Gemmatimonadota bacterium]
MSAGRFCTREVVVASAPDTIRTAARRMAEHNVGAILVTDEENRPAGILTARDLAIRCVAEERDIEGTTVGDVMTQPAPRVHEDTSIEDALKKMASAGHRRLAVVDGQERLVGVLAMDDVLDWI